MCASTSTFERATLSIDWIKRKVEIQHLVASVAVLERETASSVELYNSPGSPSTCLQTH
jgi:hypothetical protein